MDTSLNELHWVGNGWTAGLRKSSSHFGGEFDTVHLSIQGTLGHCDIDIPEWLWDTMRAANLNVLASTLSSTMRKGDFS